MIDDPEAYDNVEMPFPKFMEGELCRVTDFETSLKKMLRIQLLEVGNHLLAHGLEERGCVRRKEENLDERIFWKNILLEARRVRRGIVQRYQTFQREALLFEVLLDRRPERQVDLLYEKLPRPPGFGISPPHHLQLLL